ncbi:MAG: hypothetical protein ACO3A4_11505 [Silvanigrellaceae bacterium]
MTVRTASNKKPTFAIALAAGCVALLSCVKKNQSQPQHAIGTLPLRSEPFLWQEMTVAEFTKEVLPNMWVMASESDLIPDTDARVKLLQEAMNQFHAKVTKKYPSLANVPQPRAALFRDSSMSAFVETVPYCAEATILLPGSTDKPVYADAVRITKDGSLADRDLCRAADSTLFNSYVGFLNSLSHGCRLEKTGSAFKLSPACRLNAYFNGYSKATRFSFDRISSVIYFSTGLLDTLQDNKLVIYTLMHELAHYYRAHPLLPEADFAIFYSVGEKNTPSFPVPDEELSRLAREKNFAELTRIMIERRLGYYSFEQEADEFALEFLAELGISTADGGESMMRMLKNTKKVTPPELDYESCAALRAQKWMTSNNVSAYVPIGNLADPHHSLCYRAYNLDRERDAHRFP